jgi:outer membrane murein-binding lipoprotein Lpp
MLASAIVNHKPSLTTDVTGSAAGAAPINILERKKEAIAMDINAAKADPTRALRGFGLTAGTEVVTAFIVGSY